MSAEDGPRERQHHSEGSCCQALCNATDPPDPFDPSSAFFVAGQAISPAKPLGVPVESVVAVLAPTAEPGSQPRPPNVRRSSLDA
jgi:hypothetical protein